VTARRSEEEGRCVLYAAKSTEDKRGSIPTQLADCRALADGEGWSVAAEYEDEAASAYKGNRGQGLADAKAHAERLAANGDEAFLIVQHTDRLARGDGRTADHLVEVVLWALKAGVRLASVQDAQTVAGGLAFAAMMGDRNHEDSRRKSLATRAGKHRRAAAGKGNGGPRAYGFRWEGPRGEMRRVAVKAEAVVVVRMYRDYLGGKSQLAIVRELNQEGVPTVKGSTWYQGTVRQILTNPIYAGLERFEDNLIEASHEAIIDRELWGRVQEVRAAASKGGGKGRGRPPRGPHLFVRGHLRCGSCGDAMIPRSHGDHESYACNGRYRHGADYCDQATVPRRIVDQAIYDEFERRWLDVADLEARIRAAVDAEATEIRTLREQAEREAQRAAEAFQRVQRDYFAGDLTAAEWRDLRALAIDQADAANDQLRRLAERAEAVERAAEKAAEADTLHHLARLRAAIAGRVADSESIGEVRNHLRALFDRFTLNRGDDGSLYLTAAYPACDDRHGAEWGVNATAIAELAQASAEGENKYVVASAS
jgi:DNA invertase Pin-like site-specific DNA recombinase